MNDTRLCARGQLRAFLEGTGKSGSSPAGTTTSATRTSRRVRERFTYPRLKRADKGSTRGPGRLPSATITRSSRTARSSCQPGPFSRSGLSARVRGISKPQGETKTNVGRRRGGRPSRARASACQFDRPWRRTRVSSCEPDMRALSTRCRATRGPAGEPAPLPERGHQPGAGEVAGAADGTGPRGGVHGGNGGGVAIPR